jgi:hypothetical protein
LPEPENRQQKGGKMSTTYISGKGRFEVHAIRLVKACGMYDDGKDIIEVQVYMETWSCLQWLRMAPGSRIESDHFKVKQIL